MEKSKPGALVDADVRHRISFHVDGSRERSLCRHSWRQMQAALRTLWYFAAQPPVHRGEERHKRLGGSFERGSANQVVGILVLLDVALRIDVPEAHLFLAQRSICCHVGDFTKKSLARVHRDNGIMLKM